MSMDVGAVIACNRQCRQFEALSRLWSAFGQCDSSGSPCWWKQPERRIGISAPKVQAKALRRLFRAQSRHTVLDRACGLFVPIVEEGWSDTEVAVDCHAIWGAQQKGGYPGSELYSLSLLEDNFSVMGLIRLINRLLIRLPGGKVLKHVA